MIPRERKKLSRPVMREVRRRCGFGCVICGRPIYEYHHIIPHSEGGTDDASNLVLVCPNHHDEVTRGFGDDGVRIAMHTPWNIEKGASSPWSGGLARQHHEVIIGTNTFRLDPASRSSWPGIIPVVVDGYPLVELRVEDGATLLSIRMFDATNRLYFDMADNSLVFSPGLFDVTFEGTTFRARHGELLILEIDFAPPITNIRRATFQYNGAVLLANEYGLHVVGTGGKHTSWTNCGFSGPISVSVGPLPRHMIAVVTTEIDRFPFATDADAARFEREMKKIAKREYKRPSLTAEDKG